jgi:signal transduction histidine kinase
MAFQIKQKKFPHIPFIIVSGVIGEEKAVELIKDGVTDYVLKDKLFTLSSKIARALKDDAETKEKKRIDLKLKAQYENLLEIALMQSHQVRGPITRIIGLSRLFKFDEPAHPLNGEIVSRMKAVAVSLDKLIHKIVQKTSEIKEGR